MEQTRMLDSAVFNGLCVAADWIRDLEINNSRLHKESVIEKALVAARLGSSSAQCFLYNCYVAYNPFYVYNIKQVPETQGLDNMENPWVEFWSLLEGLRTRSISGNKAKSHIDEVSQRFDSEEWNTVCRRVILKDLRCGISEKTLNKVLKNSDWVIPVFECQLAQDSNGQPAKMKGNKRLEVKLDGVRIIAIVKIPVLPGAVDVSLFSRNGKPLVNFPKIEQAIASNSAFTSTIKHKIGQQFILDGEIVGKSFQELMRQAHRKTDVTTDDAVYHIFDVLPLGDFQAGHWNKPQSKRLEILEAAEFAISETDCLNIMTGHVVDLSTAEGYDHMTRFAEDAVDQGFEGIMIKNLDAPYECRRSSFWLKWKPFIEVSLEIVAVEEGTGRNQGKLGAFVCKGVDDGRDICVNVGSGFSDNNRTEYWNNRDQLQGHVVEIRADVVTQNQDGTYSLRFPRFLRFRGFVPGEKL
jgi:DNA ligase-1